MNLKDLIVKYMKNNNNEDSNNNQKVQVAKSGGENNGSNRKVNEEFNSNKNKFLIKNNTDLENKFEAKKTNNLKSSKANTRNVDNKDFQNIIQRQVKSGKKLLDDNLVENFQKKNETKNMV